jgi:hypothetical protein
MNWTEGQLIAGLALGRAEERLGHADAAAVAYERHLELAASASSTEEEADAAYANLVQVRQMRDLPVQQHAATSVKGDTST